MGLISSLLVPFPMSLALASGAFIAVNFVMTDLRRLSKNISTFFLIRATYLQTRRRHMIRV
jgi:hypothetical protein